MEKSYLGSKAHQPLGPFLFSRFTPVLRVDVSPTSWRRLFWPQYLNHRNEAKGLLYCSWCICIYIFMCTYKYTIYSFFFPIFHSLILYPYWSQHFLEMDSFFTILLRLGIFGESEGLLLLAPLAKQPLTAWSLRGWKEPLTAECMKPWIFNFGEQESST